jgi:hypothetical protein
MPYVTPELTAFEAETLIPTLNLLLAIARDHKSKARAVTELTRVKRKVDLGREAAPTGGSITPKLTEREAAALAPALELMMGCYRLIEAPRPTRFALERVQRRLDVARAEVAAADASPARRARSPIRVTGGAR